MNSIKYFSTILFVLFASFCSDSSTNIIRGEIRVEENPVVNPTEIADSVIYPGARIQYAAVFRSQDFWAQPEAMAAMESASSLAEVEEFYRNFISTGDWKIIQSRKTEDSLLLMAESDYRKLMTVIVRHNEPLTSIRIYFKRSGS